MTTQEQAKCIKGMAFRILTNATTEQWAAWYKVVNGWSERYPVDLGTIPISHQMTDDLVLMMIEAGLPVEEATSTMTLLVSMVPANRLNPRR